MKVIFLLFYLIVQITIIDASNQYLGCFIDQIGNRDLKIFLGDYEQLTPKQCILLCHEQNFPYAAIQYGNECRCDRQYGKYGQASDNECDYLCSTSEKCGGVKRNSVYSVVNSLDVYNTAATCQNNLVGYYGCFDSISPEIKMNQVDSINECVEHCAIKYNYAGIMNGNLCYCGNKLHLPSLNSNLCNIRCHTSTNNRNIDCCGGLNVFSVYHIKDYQYSIMNRVFDTIIRAVNDSTHVSSYTTYASSIPSIISSSTLHTVTTTAITSQQFSTTISSSLSISSSYHPEVSSTHMSQSTLFTTNRMNSISNSVYSSLMMSSVTSATPISSTDILKTLLTTSHLDTSTASRLVVSNTIATHTSSISFSQSSTNLITAITSSSGINSLYSAISRTGMSSSVHPYSNENTDSSTRIIPSTSYSSAHTDTSYHTNTVPTSSFHPISSQPSSHLDTGTSTHLITSISQSNSMNSNTPTFIHTDTTHSETSLHSSGISSTGSTMINIPTSFHLLFATSTHLSAISSSSITSNNPSMTSESQRISSVILTQSSQITTSVSERSSSEQSFVNTLFSSTNSLASSSANVGSQTTITSSFRTGLTNQTTVTTTAMTSSISNSSVSTMISMTISTLPPTTTTVSISYIISTVFIIPLNDTFYPNNNTVRESIRQKFIQIINFAFRCLANSSSPNCTRTRQRMKRQICSNGYDVNFVSNISEISNNPSRKYQVDYTVLDLCNANKLIEPTQIKTATSTLSRAQVTNILGYDYDGELIRSTSIATPENPTSDKKLWLIGAVLGPVAFTLLLIFIFCYLHYKCRPRQTNRPLTKPLHDAPLSARSTNDRTVLNDLINPKPTTENNLHVLVRNDPLVGSNTSFHRLTPTESNASSNPILPYPISTDIPMDEIRRQNDVERWRNKLRLEEKFQVN